MKLILACTPSGGIGYQGSMPWPKQDKDLARFKELTLNTIILMGRGTWESTGMPKPLPDRMNIVLSSTANISDIPGKLLHCKSIKELPAIDWCIGGAKTAEQVWDQITEVHLTRIKSEYECDTFFDLERLNADFKLTRSVLCLTHKYEIWKRK